MGFFKHRKVLLVFSLHLCYHLDLTNASASPYSKPGVVTMPGVPAALEAEAGGPLWHFSGGRPGQKSQNPWQK